MKFLEYTPFIRINGFLSNVDLGDSRVRGLLEAYSCKSSGADKELSLSIEQEVLHGMSPDNLSTSPIGPLSSLASRRTLIYLILALSHGYPDYDFSMLGPHHFLKESSILDVRYKIAYHLLETTKVWAAETGEDNLMEKIWEAADEVIDTRDCEVYSLSPELQIQPFSETSTIWVFNYFFYNKKLKRVLHFNCQCTSKLASDDSFSDEDEAAEFFQGMEME